MLLTEEQAKQTACCKERAYLDNGKLVTPACLASGCLAWRTWQATEFRDELGESAPCGPVLGYCGLAGKPE